MQLRPGAWTTRSQALRPRITHARVGPRNHRSWLVGSLSALVLCCTSLNARGECASEASLSPCVPANAFWTRAGASRWSALPDPRLLPALEASYNLELEYQYKPLLLLAPSPDPDGREIALVRHRLTTTLGARLGVTDALELALSLPVVSYQTGAGTSGVTDRVADEVASPALADPRLESRLRVLPVSGLGSLDAGLTLSFPLGNESAHAREPSVVAAPELLWQLELGRFSAAAGASLRLRRTATLGTASYGNQLGGMLAADLSVVERWLGVSVQAWALTGLAAHETANGALGRTRHVDRPAEWLVSVRSSPLADITLSLGGGAAIPLSTETTSSGTQYFGGLGASTARLLLGVQYRAATPGQR